MKKSSLSKPSPTEGAGIGSLPTVSATMSPECRNVGETASAAGTGVWFFTRVSTYV